MRSERQIIPEALRTIARQTGNCDAVREAGLDMTPAPLKRPRKAAEPADLTVTVKVEPTEPQILDLVVDPTPAHEDLTALTVPQLKSRAKARGLKGFSDLNKPQLLALLA